MLKEHKKMYKSGKNWAVATMAAITMVGVAVAQTTAHADSTDKASAQVQTNPTAEDQLANLNNQLSANQASQAAADAKTMASETAKINSAASAATDQENAAYSSAAASQAAANSAALAEAQKNIYTPAQKDTMKSAAQSDYAKQATDLKANHDDKLGQISKDHDASVQDVNSQINTTKATAQKTHDEAVKSVDAKINAASTAVTDAENKAKTDQATADKAQETVDQATTNLEDAKTTVKNLEKDVHNEIKVSDKWIDSIKNARATDDINEDTPGVNLDVLNSESRKLSDANKYQDDEVAKQTPVKLNKDGSLNKDDIIFATQYAVKLINPIREKLDTPLAKINKASIDITDEVGRNYHKGNWDNWLIGHNNPLLKKVAGEWNTALVSEDLNADLSFGKETTNADGVRVYDYSNLNRNDLQRGVFNTLCGLLFRDAEAGYGHTTDILALRYPKDWRNPKPNELASCVGEVYLGVNFHSFTNDYISPAWNAKTMHAGTFSFNSESDPNNEFNQVQAKFHYIIPENDPNAKIAQPQWQENIALPTAQEIAAAKAKAKVKAQDNLKQAQANLEKANTELTSAKQAATDSAKAIQPAKDQLAKLQASRDEDINAIAKPEEFNAKIKQLQGQLTNLAAKYQSDVKAENDSYAKEAKNLETKKNDQLAKIDQLPTSVDALKKQLDAKMTKLTNDHEQKLADIKADAQKKIDAVKQQLQAANDKANQPLNDQIAQVKAQIAAKQTAAANAIKSKANSYQTNNGQSTVILPSSSSSVAKRLSAVQANDTVSVNAEANSLPQTGNQSSMAAVLLGAMTAMFGLGLGLKKRY